ncbi:hypothetical protein KKH3_10410 [Pectobacterium actinidiae]|nr:hypothetical protein KKH3_10410 [Pectobacterium actinidiae]
MANRQASDITLRDFAKGRYVQCHSRRFRCVSLPIIRY